MGTTAQFDLPYPEPTGRVRNGSTDIKALAEAVAGMWPAAAVQVDPATNGGTLTNSGAFIAFPGTLVALAGFNFDGTTIAYTGSTRLFQVHVQVQVSGQAPNPVLQSWIELQQSGVVIDQSRLVIVVDQDEPGTLETVNFTHKIAIPVQLSAGDTLKVYGAASPNATVGIVGIRVFPIGPAL